MITLPRLDFNSGRSTIMGMNGRGKTPRKGTLKAVRAASSSGSKTKKVASREIVVVDQEPLRKSAAADCTREMARLEKLRADWDRFQKEDQPCFEAWLAQNFGALLTELRTTDQVIQEKEALIEEVEIAVFLGEARNHRIAYQMVLDRRANPEPEQPPEKTGSKDDFKRRGKKAGRSEFSDEELQFHEFIEACFGLFPEDLSKAHYSTMFAKFKEEVLGQKPPKKQSSPANRLNTASPEASGSTRMKEIYRILVRRLHPDSRTTEHGAVSTLWHDVQDAYATGNLERLEMLLALSDLESAVVGESTSLQQIHAVLQELRRSVQALLRSISGAKKDPAWNFSRTTDHSAIHSRLTREFKRDRKQQQEEMAEIDELLESWSTSRKTRKPKRDADFW